MAFTADWVLTCANSRISAMMAAEAAASPTSRSSPTHRCDRKPVSPAPGPLAPPSPESVSDWACAEGKRAGAAAAGVDVKEGKARVMVVELRMSSRREYLEKWLRYTLCVCVCVRGSGPGCHIVCVLDS